jgi:hypothetical protein
MLVSCRVLQLCGLLDTSKEVKVTSPLVVASQLREYGLGYQLISLKNNTITNEN